MLALALTLSLGGTLTPQPDFYETHLTAPQGVLLDTLKGARGGQIYSGVRMTVSGSILIVIGLIFGTPGVAFLIGAANANDNSRLPFTVLGWTFFGIGALCAAVGIPLLIVGIANLAGAPPKNAKLRIGAGSNGQLALLF